MQQYALLINYDYCTGCHACEIACRNEHGFDRDRWGIKLVDLGPLEIGDERWEWDHIAVPTELCDMCEERVAAGKKPACAHHCLASVIEWGSAEDLAKKAVERGLTKSALYFV